MSTRLNEPQDQLAMAFDYGTRRIGVAVGHPRLGSASALAPIKARDGIPDWNLIRRLVDEWKPGYFVVGMPYNMDGSESELCARSRKFGQRLRGRYAIGVAEMDERLTSFEAREQLNDEASSESVDSRAACLILESWFRSTPARKIT